ncbi:hypothetical protein DFQ26_007169 [Actinomortierella ambigua]|nr:hypothetical protein DFQ26_007169 [Actinomortierella ambigua]
MAETLDPSDQSGDHTAPRNDSSTTTILQAERPNNQSSKPCDEASTLSQTLEQLDLEEGGSGPFNATLDEFLMTALRSNKDRMFLLKLDREFGFFISDPLKNKLEFPTMNSYHRMVIHRVANYFNLRRIVHPVHKTVVLFKTEYSAIPALRFSDLVEEEEEQVIKPIQLLRRNPDRTTTTMNEAGESTPEPERKTMTIKEREEAYAKARARIFQEGPGASKTPDSSGSTSRCDSPAVNPTSTAMHVAKHAEGDEDDATTKPMKSKKQPSNGGSTSTSINNAISSGNSNNSGKKKKPAESQPGSPELVRSPDALDASRHDWAHSNSSSRNVSRSGSPTTPTPAAGHAVTSGSDVMAVRKPKTKLSKSDLQTDSSDGRRRRSTTSTTSSSSGAARTPVGLARTESSSSSQDGHHSPGPTTFATASPAAISPMHSASTPPKVIDYFGIDPPGVAPSHSRTHTPTQGRVNSTGSMKGSGGQSYSGKKSYPPSGYNSTNMGHYGLNANTGYPSVPPHHGPYTHPLPTGPPPSQPMGPWMTDPMQYSGPDMGSYGPGYSPGGPGHHPGHPQAAVFHAPPHQYKQPMDPGFQQAQQRPAYSHHQHHLSSHSQPHVPHSNYYHPQQPQNPPQQHGSFQHPGQQAHHHHHQHYQPYFQPNHSTSRAGPPNGAGGNVRPRYSQDHQFHRSPSNKRFNQAYDPSKGGPSVNGGGGGYYGPGVPLPANASYDFAPPAGPLGGQSIRPQGHRGHSSGGSKYHGKHKNQQHVWSGSGFVYQPGSGVSGPPWTNTAAFGGGGGSNGAGHGSNNTVNSNNNTNTNSSNKHHVPGTGYTVMSSQASANMYDIERRPPKSTELFDPNSSQSSSSGPSTINTTSNHEGNNYSTAMEGAAGSTSDGMLLHDSYMQHQHSIDSTHGPTLMSRSYSSNSTTSSGQTPTPSSAGGGTLSSTSKKNLLYDYSVPMAGPYEGVLKGPSQEKSMPEHILEVYGFHPEDDFLDDLALPAGGKLKHVKPAGLSGGATATTTLTLSSPSPSPAALAHGQYLVIFKNAAVATEALAAFQDGRETWLKKSSRLGFNGPLESEDNEQQQQQQLEGQSGEDDGQNEEGEEPLLRNTRFQVRVWAPLLVQSLLPTVGGPPSGGAVASPPPHPLPPRGTGPITTTTTTASVPSVASPKGSGGGVDAGIVVVDPKEPTPPVQENSRADEDADRR